MKSDNGAVTMPRLLSKECHKLLLLTILLSFCVLFYYQSILGKRVRDYEILKRISKIKEVMYELGKLQSRNSSTSTQTSEQDILNDEQGTMSPQPNRKSEATTKWKVSETITKGEIVYTRSTIFTGLETTRSTSKLTSIMVQCMDDLKRMNISSIRKNVALPNSCRMAVRKENPKIKKICSKRDQSTIGPLYVDKSPITLETLYKETLPYVQEGGRWSPENCTSKTKTAIVIPYRDREEHLAILLRQLIPILKRQMLAFQIFVIEQGDKDAFNRGKLMNVGYAEALAMDEFSCFVFHDVDLIPEDDRIDYGCHASPQHLSVAVDKFNYKLPYQEIFGGVEMFTTSHFQDINGFSNSFWGWGAEDDNLYHRLVNNRMTLWRQSPAVAKYMMLKHNSNEANADPKRFNILDRSKEYISTDGLNNLQYVVMETKLFHLYTRIKVDLVKGEDRLFGVLEKITDIQ